MEFESILEALSRSGCANFEGPLDLAAAPDQEARGRASTTFRSPLITQQYLDYIDLMQEMNLDVAGEFLVMAATLIHIKSRMLLPRPDPAQEDPEEDPREALIRRLLEHQKFKAAAELLHERETLRSAQWTRPDGPIAEIAGEAPEPEIEVDLFSLISAFRAVVERAKQRPKVYLPAEQIPIEDRIEQLMARLSETEACGFEDLFADVQTRAGLIVTFLALLEMIRLKLIRVFQAGASARSASTSARGRPTRRSRCSIPRRHAARQRRTRRAAAATPLAGRDPRRTERRVEARVRPSQTHRRSADLRVAGAGDAEDALQAARRRAARRTSTRRSRRSAPTTIGRGGLQIVEVAGGYQIVTRPELHEWVRKLFHERTTQKLSVQSLETLAVIAYKQPVTAPEIAEIRGVSSSGGVLSTLIERKLIKTVGRKQVVGRPFMYAHDARVPRAVRPERPHRSAEGRGDVGRARLRAAERAAEPTVATTALPFDASPEEAVDGAAVEEPAGVGTGDDTVHDRLHARPEGRACARPTQDRAVCK